MSCAVQTLNTQVEAALQSGLNFKDRFRTNSLKRRVVLLPAEAEPEQEEQQLDAEAGTIVFAQVHRVVNLLATA